MLPFLKKVKEIYKDTKNVWSYTGFIYDKDLVKGGRAYTEYTNELLSLIDILVDGPFVEEKKNIMLKFRGSSNQRVIDIKNTLKTGKIVLYLQ